MYLCLISNKCTSSISNCFLGVWQFQVSSYTEWEEVGSQKINLLEILYFFILSKAERNVAMSPGVSKGARDTLTVSLAVQGLYKNLGCRGGIWFIGRVVQPLLIAAEGGPASVQCNLS